jgi:spoIIIJ-associated protein
VSNVDVPLEEQGEVAREFLAGLIQEFGLTAQVVATVGEEDTVDVDITGEGLGLLIGPKGATLLALQDLTRSAVQQKTSAGNGRIHVDVSGYRQKRSEALARFANEVAETVKSSGVRQALEPMSAVDRKVIHDALTDVEGVSTISEGEDARRRVVIVPTPA